MPSQEYNRALIATRKLHDGDKLFSGRFLDRYLKDIEPLIAQYSVRTILDYGCGRAVRWLTPEPDGRLLADRLGVEVTLYDPGRSEYAAEPAGKFDLVICTQVLGSIPVIDLPWVISRLYSYAGMAVYVGERLGPVRKKIHKDMAAEGLMPHGWTRDRWARAVRRDTHGPVLYLRTNDKRTGESVLGSVP